MSVLWMIRSAGADGPPIVLYDYQQSRAGEHPKAFLAGFTGYLHVDGYAAYDTLPHVTLVGCWAHARRNFHEALQALPPNKRQVIGKAVTYCLNQWEKVRRFLDDGRLEIDNNRAERSIKPFVIRKNWLFANTPSGARASAVLYSMVETAISRHNPLDSCNFATQEEAHRYPRLRPFACFSPV